MSDQQITNVVPTGFWLGEPGDHKGRDIWCTVDSGDIVVICLTPTQLHELTCQLCEYYGIKKPEFYEDDGQPVDLPF